MVQTILNQDEIMATVRKTVNPNGVISIGKEHEGKRIVAYIVEDKGHAGT